MVARTDLTRVRRYGFVITDIHKLINQIKTEKHETR